MVEYELKIVDYYKFENGEIVLFGYVFPSDGPYIGPSVGASKGYLYSNGKFIQEISIIGEEIYVPRRSDKRGIKIKDDISHILSTTDGNTMKVKCHPIIKKDQNK